jgi:hypothetical protein
MKREKQNMKELGLILFFVTIFSCWITCNTHAQEWYTANQITVTWDAVTTLSNNSTIPVDNLIEYTVYLSNIITDSDKLNPIEVETVNVTESTVTLDIEGQYFVGLKTIRKLANGTFIEESVIGWSDDPLVVLDEHTFGLKYFLSPATIKGLRCK